MGPEVFGGGGGWFERDRTTATPPGPPLLSPATLHNVHYGTLRHTPA